MTKHLENPLFQDLFEFGSLNRKRLLFPDEVESYCKMLVKLLDHAKSRMRWIAADQLGKLKYKQAVEPLIASLNDPHWLVRLHCAKALGRIGDKQALMSLIHLMKDVNSYVRRTVVTALGNWGNEDVVIEVLTSALNDPDPKFRARAAWTFASIDNPKSTDILIKAVKDRDTNVSCISSCVLSFFHARLLIEFGTWIFGFGVAATDAGLGKVHSPR